VIIAALIIGHESSVKIEDTASKAKQVKHDQIKEPDDHNA
jgi:hypothetical protein